MKTSCWTGALAVVAYITFGFADAEAAELRDRKSLICTFDRGVASFPKIKEGDFLPIETTVPLVQVITAIDLQAGTAHIETKIMKRPDQIISWDAQATAGGHSLTFFERDETSGYAALTTVYHDVYQDVGEPVIAMATRTNGLMGYTENYLGMCN